MKTINQLRDQLFLVRTLERMVDNIDERSKIAVLMCSHRNAPHYDMLRKYLNCSEKQARKLCKLPALALTKSAEELAVEEATLIADLQSHLQYCESMIMSLAYPTDQSDYVGVSREQRGTLEQLFSRRNYILNIMFDPTESEIARLKRINYKLLEMTQDLYRDMRDYYTKRKADNDLAFPTGDMELHFSFEYAPDAVAQLPEDDYYKSSFDKMLEILSFEDGFSYPHFENVTFPVDPDYTPDFERDILNVLDDGTTWAEAWLSNPKLRDICFCHAVHDIVFHHQYSIPDLLRMSKFWYEMVSTYQKTVTI